MQVHSDIVGPTQPPHVPSRQAFTVNITPQSNHAIAQPNPEEDNKVEDVNVYLSEDIKGRVRLSIEDFLDVVLQLSPTEYDQFAHKTGNALKNSRVFHDAWKQYEMTCKDRKMNEKDLYKPLVNALNASMAALFGTTAPLLFYDGSESPVRGSYTDRKPDIGALSREHAVDENIVKSMRKYWPMLMYFVEVKRRKGGALDYGPITKKSKANATLPSGTDAPSQAESSSLKDEVLPSQKEGSRQSHSDSRLQSSSQPTSSSLVDDTQLPQLVGMKRKRSAFSKKQEHPTSRSSGTGSQSRTSASRQASTSALAAAAQPTQHRYNTRSRSAIPGTSQTQSSAPAQASTSSHQTTAAMSTSDNSSTLAELVASRTDEGMPPATPPGQQDEDDESGDQKRRKGEEGSKIPITNAEGEVQAEGAPEVDKVEVPVEEEDKLSDTQIVTHTLLQCAGYGLEMLSAGAVRNHSIGMIVDDHFLQIAYYDRSKVVLSEPIDFFHAKGQMRLLAALHQLGELSRRQCGPFSDTSQADAFPRISPLFNAKYLKGSQDQIAKKGGQQSEVPDGKMPGCDALSGCRLTLKKGIQLELQEIIYRAHGVIGRGTTVFRAKCSRELQKQWKHDSEEVIVKISFPGAKREAEDVICDKALRKAEELGDDHSWVKNHLPNILYSETYAYGRDMPQLRLSEFLDEREPYELRNARVTVQELLAPITDLTAAIDYGQAFLDILQVHRWLVDHPKILHRDITLANVMFRRKDRVYGVLNDFDLASSLPPGVDPSSQQRTGTKPFMSHELLDSGWVRGHFYRHDLEGLFYTALITCCHHRSDKSGRIRLLPREQRPYHNWYTNSNSIVCRDKWFFISKPPRDVPVTTFFEPLKEHIVELLYTLYDGYSQQSQYSTRQQYLSRPRSLAIRRSHAKQQGPDSDPAVEAFNWHTLHGHVTYESFLQIMGSDVAGQALVLSYNNPLPLNPADFQPAPKEDNPPPYTALAYDHPPPPHETESSPTVI